MATSIAKARAFPVGPHKLGYKLSIRIRRTVGKPLDSPSNKLLIVFGSALRFVSHAACAMFDQRVVRR